MAIVVGPTLWQFGVQVAATALCSSIAGGFLICKAGGIGWIVSPYSTEVSRTWYLRNDSITTAQSVSGCTGWFVPSSGQLQNPGVACLSFWGPSPCYSNNPSCVVSVLYWGNSERMSYPGNGDLINLTLNCGTFSSKNNVLCVRAFRCVAY